MYNIENWALCDNLGHYNSLERDLLKEITNLQDFNGVIAKFLKPQIHPLFIYLSDLEILEKSISDIQHNEKLERFETIKSLYTTSLREIILNIQKQQQETKKKDKSKNEKEV